MPWTFSVQRWLDDSLVIMEINKKEYEAKWKREFDREWVLQYVERPDAERKAFFQSLNEVEQKELLDAMWDIVLL
jgi:hypothetical protein